MIIIIKFKNYKLTYDEIKNILGFEIDHSFFKYKKELENYGYVIVKINMKNKTIEFNKLGGLLCH